MIMVKQVHSRPIVGGVTQNGGGAVKRDTERQVLQHMIEFDT